MKLASQRQSILEVDAHLQKLRDQFGWEEKLFSRILTSINEAVTNAIRHGNRNDPSRLVTFDFVRSDKGTFIFTITDEGEGFDWQRKHSVLAQQEGNDEEGGRGLLLMEQLSDEHFFNKKGNSIALHFKA